MAESSEIVKVGPLNYQRHLSSKMKITVTRMFSQSEGMGPVFDPFREKRAVYGKQIVAALGRHLTTEFGTEDRMTPDLVFRDLYLLDFLGLNDRYLEKNLEDAILREIETCLLELGNGFAFLGRQTRIQIDSDDFYLDLLFYHRNLRRLIAIDLKLGNFKAEYKGQMELYLRWLARHEQQPGEEPPLGIILCAGKKEEQIELLELGRSGIHVAEYLTALPSRELLQQKLHDAIEISQARLEAKKREAE